MSFYLGVDGGGTKTTAVLLDTTGAERGRGEAGSSNPSGVGFETAVAHITAAIQSAAAQAGVSPPFAAAWFGLAGVDRPADIARFTPALQPFAQTIQITNDAALILSGLQPAVGVALIAGTGTIALGLDMQGKRARAGGWGWRFSDEGSGYSLGIGALRALSQAADGRGPATLLHDAILVEWGLTQASDVIGKVYGGVENTTIAALSALVFHAARAGDAIARALMQDGANELARMVVAAARDLVFADGLLPLAFGGGLLVHEGEYREMVLQAIRCERPIGAVAIVADPANSAAASMRQRNT